MTYFFSIVGMFLLVIFVSICLSGCAVNGHPMRFEPTVDTSAKSLSWYIEGKTKTGRPISCSFVEFDERGDFIDFRQHRDCEAKITNMTASGPVLLVMYCHGWKNNSHSEDVVKFNSFLAKIADSQEIREKGFRVHGVFLSWRGNVVQPFVDRSASDEFYQDCLTNYGEPIVSQKYNRGSDWMGFLPENIDFFTRQRAAEHLVSGLPIARAIFTYASAAKQYGAKQDNQVIVMGHSMGALMLEKSLGQALTGSLVMEWWDGVKQMAQKPALPFDLILFLNSAAPSIYAKEMRDFLEANRNAQRFAPGTKAPVIISLTSTADSATGTIYPLAHVFAPLQPSLHRCYTNGIFGSENQTHPGIRQSKFYTKTPGHQPYLINHWVVPDKAPAPVGLVGQDDVFDANISVKKTSDPYVFYTSDPGHPSKAWRVTNETSAPVTLDGLRLSMQESDYWIMNCGKELIASHGDIWSTKTMEMYAALYRLTAYLRDKQPSGVSTAPQ